jgi:hypothetical protein
MSFVLRYCNTHLGDELVTLGKQFHQTCLVVGYGLPHFMEVLISIVDFRNRRADADVVDQSLPDMGRGADLGMGSSESSSKVVQRPIFQQGTDGRSFVWRVTSPRNVAADRLRGCAGKRGRGKDIRLSWEVRREGFGLSSHMERCGRGRSL